LDADLDRDGSNLSAAEQEHERRNFDFSRSLHGMAFTTGTFDVLGAEIIETALNTAYDRGHAQNDPRTPGQQRADALVDICRLHLERNGTPGRANLPHVLLVTDRATGTGSRSASAASRADTASRRRPHGASCVTRSRKRF
jgi:hypothetical protein